LAIVILCSEFEPWYAYSTKETLLTTDQLQDSKMGSSLTIPEVS
jgi:hypothetical protein